MDNKIEVLSTIRLQYTNNLYKIVETPKERDLMFGLALDEKETAVFTIYRT